jgi:hypothetical protein
MYNDNTNQSIYEAIARAILTRGSNRVLTFHAGVNGDSETDVKNFVDKNKFISALCKIQQTEFPKKENYTKITFKGMYGSTCAKDRVDMLTELDETHNNEIYIISSCETIGEGVDTKTANMCVFVDPKTSQTKIIQNIGRVVRRNPDSPMSTILIPCFVNMENYAEANGDAEKQDGLIRQQMRDTNGDYAPILNVLGALKQEDPEIYDQCLNYPNRKTKAKAKAKLLKEKGLKIDKNTVYTSDNIEQLKETDKIPLEIHTNKTIEQFNEDIIKEPLRLYYDEESDVYNKIIPIQPNDNENESDSNNETDSNSVSESDTKPNTKPKIKLSIHINNDIEMLWKIKGELDFSKKFSSVVIECNVSGGVERWNITLIKVCDYMDKEKKRPSESDKNPDIKKLGMWVSHQKTNYTKNVQIMSKPEILCQIIISIIIIINNYII